MCGRFTLSRLADFTDLFPWIRPPDEPPQPRYNIAPSQTIAAVPNRHPPKIEFLRWGLIPSWAKDPAIGNRMINARAETLARKPAFRTALRRRRCLIPADGFFEWKKNPRGAKTPMYIRMKDGRPFAFAGLWELWHDPGGAEIPSCTIITTDSNELLRDIHDRMPVILPEEAWPSWLDPEEKPPDSLLALLKPYPAQAMSASPVSRKVNNPKADGPQCIQPANEPDTLFP